LQPSREPSSQPSRTPTGHPSPQYTYKPTTVPSSQDSRSPSILPTSDSSNQPSATPSVLREASTEPSIQSSTAPSPIADCSAVDDLSLPEPGVNEIIVTILQVICTMTIHQEQYASSWITPYQLS
jgi:hypothetical protein